MEARRPLDGESFDVAIVGGGINGVAIARECAVAGKRTLLVEQNDFSCGTTSRATRIIHGGLRYLEHGEIGLVRESLRERQRLLAERPHLVRPLQFLLALPPGGRSAMEVRFGLWLYARFGGRFRGRQRANDAASLERLLDRNGDARAWRVFRYDDGQCEFPERLVAEWLVDAVAAGAEVRNHTQALAVESTAGRVCGLRLRESSGREYRVVAQWIVNATGPWADRLALASGVHTHEPMIGGVRGSHIVLPRFAGAPDSAVYTEAVDRRPIFVVPWNEQLLVGTTEVADAGDPARTRPDKAEIEYLMNSMRRLFPSTQLGEIRYSFAGVRPLPYTPGLVASAITRRHLLHDHAADGAVGMISVIGGKLTTAASLARQCVRAVGVAVREPEGMVIAPYAAIEEMLQACAAEVSQSADVPEETARAMVTWHGPAATKIARLVVDERLRAPLCQHSAHIVAEALHAFWFEQASTLGDVLLRRVPVALGACWSESCTRTAAARIAAVVGWDQQRLHVEVEGFEAERAGCLGN
jgi:glycerol-3-phosphate dehydrogenase